MDVLCRFCREPWDFDCMHDEVDERRRLGVEADYAKVSAEFRAYGCTALWAFQGFEPVTEKCGPAEDPVISVMYELLGSDMDGAAAMLEDMGIY